ncbi:hypothetical protein [Alistipes finegoldii]|jgi:hypothetical protein|uniref:hypothetical protein n=1 Tax=Alistipes finegoldii TaxID=214856 RepID=UPI001DB592E1|nr:hypothetical protein [Alistipes finegoldii]HJG72437.1 hypothetical protein [Alistipes finegoldii]
MDNPTVEKAIIRALKKTETSVNQNVLLLIPSLSALWLGVHHDNPPLIIFGLILSTIATVSVAITFYAYTVKYWRDKLK